MKMYNHKHDGIFTSTGSLRMHPIKRKHQDKTIQRYHNESLSSTEQNKYWQGDKKKTSTQKVKYEHGQAICGIDEDGYINIDLRNADCKGLRVVFSRTEGDVKRKVGLEIDK